MIQALLVTICLAVFPYQGSSIILEAGNVNDYEVVYPQKVHALPKRGAHPHEQKTKYEDHMQYEFKVNGEPVVLHLDKNIELLSKDYTKTHYSPDGREITTSPQVEDHCYYHGYIQNDADSTASISACRGLKGHFKHQGETYFIEPLKFSNSEAHAVYKYENIEKEDESPKTCGLTHTTWESDKPIEMSPEFTVTLEQMQYLEAKKYVEFYLVVDNFMFKKYSSNVTTVENRVFEMINHLSLIYKALNINVALIGLDIWSDEDKILVTGSSNPTLDAFAAWRESDLLKRKWNDHAQLLTALDLHNGVLGVAFLSAMCNSENSAGLVQDHSKVPFFVAAAMAHEMGHALGMTHDKDSCICQSGPCIMTTKAQDKAPWEFSSCSMNDHYTYLIKYTPQCLLNKPFSKDIVTSPICGNEFVEKGEECDCGSPEQCENDCCEAGSCKLKPGAKCADGECCEKCQFRRSGEECRTSKDDCDLPEFCTGQSAECPMDRLQKNGQPCQNNWGYCYNGKCPLLAKQCFVLWGPDAKVASKKCFMLNTLGDEYGRCRKENGKNIQCEPEDILCGRLHCTGGTERPAVGAMGSLNECKISFSTVNAEIGMVEPGTKCEDRKVCNKGQCVDMNTVYESTINYSQI